MKYEITTISSDNSDQFSRKLAEFEENNNVINRHFTAVGIPMAQQPTNGIIPGAQQQVSIRIELVYMAVMYCLPEKMEQEIKIETEEGSYAASAAPIRKLNE